jgi:hypothetical protein
MKTNLRPSALRISPAAMILCAGIALLPTAGGASASAKQKLPREEAAKATYEWKETIELKGRSVILTGRQYPGSQGAPGVTRYFDASGKPMSAAFAAARQKHWESVPAVEVDSEVRTQEAQATPPAPHSVRPGVRPPSLIAGLPALDLTPVLQEDKQRVAGEKAGRRVGVRRTLPKPLTISDADAQSGWQVLKDGSRLWNAELHSDGAQAIRVQFSAVQWVPGARVIVFDAGKPDEAVGPYDASSFAGAPSFWSGTIFADRVVVECWVPAGTPRGGLSFRIAELTHRYRAVKEADATEKLGPCHNDVTCFPAWTQAAKAVAGIGVVGSTGELVCTGTLVADNDPGTTINYFLTAHHCIGDQLEADTSEFYWFYQSSTCNGAPPSPASVPRTGGGAELLATMTGTQGNDFSLIRLRNDAAIPAGVVYAGWSTIDPGDTEELAVIHHPDGSHKRISFAKRIGATQNFLQVVYHDGSTEPGSSGSPLFNAQQKIIGQLKGGEASCELMDASDTYGRFSVTYPVIERWLLGQPVVAANDLLADAQAISGVSGTLQTSNSGSSKETGEPKHGGNGGGRSIWFAWNPPSTGMFTFDTDGSGFDTLLAVYTGTSVGALTSVASNDDNAAIAPASQVTIPAVQGTLCYIAVDGYDGSAGPVTLNWRPASDSVGANDLFANAQRIESEHGWVVASNDSAGAEPGEPDHGGVHVGKSIWFRWTAPKGQLVMIDTEGSQIDTVMAVYTGSALGALTLVADNDDIDFQNDNYASRVRFTAEAGMTYCIAVDGYYDETTGITESGDILLHWYMYSDVATPPANDAFAQATVLSGSTGSVAGSNDFASREAGEPTILANPGGASVWYRWIAPVSGLAIFSTEGSAFDTLLAAYQGTAVNALTLLDSNDDSADFTLSSRITVPVVAGAEYWIAVEGFNTESDIVRAGPVALSWNLCEGCGGNDNFADAQVLRGAAGSVVGSTVSATRESLDPTVAGNSGGKTIWFRWVAGVSGTVTIDTFGSTFDTLLGAYTGSQLGALQLVAANDDDGPQTQSRVSFNATAGAEYRIIVAGYRSGTGAIEGGSVALNWSQPAGITTQVSQPRVTAGDVFSLIVTGLPNRSFEVERSGDLGAWVKVGTVFTAGGSATFTDTEPVRGARFYRARLVP